MTVKDKIQSLGGKFFSNHLDEQIDTDEHVEIEEYSLAIDYDNHVSIAGANYDLSSLYDEIGIDFRNRLDDLASFKTSFNLKKNKTSFNLKK